MRIKNKRRRSILEPADRSLNKFFCCDEKQVSKELSPENNLKTKTDFVSPSKNERTEKVNEVPEVTMSESTYRMNVLLDD